MQKTDKNTHAVEKSKNLLQNKTITVLKKKIKLVFVAQTKTCRYVTCRCKVHFVVAFFSKLKFV